MSEEKPIIEILDPIHEALKRINRIMVGVLIVLGVGFITLLIAVSGLIIDAYHFKSISYKALIEKNVYLEKIINEYKLEQKELKTTIENLSKDINKISDNISSNKLKKE